ncbi:MAG: hypothetical protein NZ929_05475 [Aigarchaeota archaeon]|nr:hypothetical protein [Aigarchaeota archaeon]MCX8193325.1 hypothetical protein [Nitrososphaeria archaeon]MDW7986544.1 hypothetical protein [Nitrososphaerota archaeon]
MRRRSYKYARTTIPLVIFIYLITIFSFNLTSTPPVFSQEFGERLHTDWTIVDHKITPSVLHVGERTKLQVSVGIATIIEPLPQTVEVVLKIDGIQREIFSLTFESDPAQVLTIQVYWTATVGKHHFEWIIDPFSKYDDPDLENNYIAFDLEITPTIETVTIATTIVKTTTVTQVELSTAHTTRIETITETKIITEEETITKATEVLSVETETVTETITLHKPLTITEKTTEVSTSLIEEITKPVDYMTLSLLGVLTLIAGILGLILGRKTSQKPELFNFGKIDNLPEEAIFSNTIYRLARRLNEDEWEAKPGEYVEDAKGIVTVDKEGNVTIVSDHQCLYSSKIEGRPLSRSDLEQMDRRILEGLLGQLKSTRETAVAMELELNDMQRQAIEGVIQKIEEELMRRKLIQ